MARSAAVACAETPSHSRGPGNIRVTVRVSFTTESVRSTILATAGRLLSCLEMRIDISAIKELID